MSVDVDVELEVVAEFRRMLSSRMRCGYAGTRVRYPGSVILPFGGDTCRAFWRASFQVVRLPVKEEKQLRRWRWKWREVAKIDEWLVEVGDVIWGRRTPLIKEVQSCLIDAAAEEWMDRRLGGLGYVKDVEVRGWGWEVLWKRALGPARGPLSSSLSSSSSDVAPPEEGEDEVVVSMAGEDEDGEEGDEISMDDPESDLTSGGESVLDALDRGRFGDGEGDISIESASG